MKIASEKPGRLVMQSYADTLLVLGSYPEPTPDHVVDRAVGIAAQLGAQISALALAVDPAKASRAYWHHRPLFDLPEVFEQTVRKSEPEARRLLALFETQAQKKGIYGGHSLQLCPLSPDLEIVARQARLRDLTFVPVPDLIGLQELYLESVVFNSGRPTMLLPADVRIAETFESAAVAWDYGRQAARALGDAVPMLAKMATVRVVTVLNEKILEEGLTRNDLDRHLRAHGIVAKFDEIDAAGRQIGTVLREYVRDCRADLLVMGAFGHSRVREFVLGGATRSILRLPPVPVLLSH